jgi:HEAT repeat protein
MDWKEYTEPDTQEKSRSRNKIKEKDSKLTSLILDLNCNPLKKREKVIEELGEMGEKAVFPLIEAIKSNSNVNIGAVIALVKIGEKAVPLLIEALKDYSEGERELATAHQGQLNFGIMFGSFTGAVRESAAEALGKIGDERAIGALIKELKFEYEDVGSRAGSSVIKIGKKMLYDRFSIIVVSALIKIGKKAIPQLIIALEDRCYLLRKNVVKILGVIGGAEVVEHLIKALGDTAKEVRVETAYMLGHRGEIRATKPLIKALNDDQWEVRRRTVEALGKIGDKQAVEPLIKTLEDIQLEVRGEAIKALGKIGEEATDSLLQILYKNKGYIRKGAIKVLMKIRDERVIVPLIEALKEELKLFYEAKDYGDEYEYFLAEELEELSELIGHLGEKAVLPLIEVLKNNTRRDVKHFAVVHLGHSADVRAVQPLIEVLDNEDYVERKAVTRGLTSIGNIRGYEYIVEPIFQLLRMRGVKIRRGAIEVLGAIGAYLSEKDVNRVIDSLTKTLKDRYEEIRKVTVTSMNRLAWAAMLGFEKVVVEGVVIERVVTSLIEALKDPKEDVRKEAIKAVGEIGTNLIWKGEKGIERLVDNLIEALIDEKGQLKADIVNVLGKIGNARISYIFNKALKDTELKKEVIEELKKVKDVRAVENLIQILEKEGDWETFEVSINYRGDRNKVSYPPRKSYDATGTIHAYRQSMDFILPWLPKWFEDIGIERLVESLIKTVEDEDKDVRIEVVDVLERIVDDRVIVTLIETLEDENEYVRCKVVESLGDIGDKRAFILLHELLATESDNSVNREIIVAMEKLEKKE